MAQSTQKRPRPPRRPPLTWPAGGVSDRPDAQGPDLMAGFWVTSFTGWQLFNPLPVPGNDTPPVFLQRVRNLPPMIGGYGWAPPQPYDPNAPGSYYQREGYFLCSVLVRIALDGFGGVKGVMELIRGGRG